MDWMGESGMNLKEYMREVMNRVRKERKKTFLLQPLTGTEQRRMGA